MEPFQRGTGHRNLSNMKEDGMEWEKPSYIEIHMNAEIGAYQDEFGGTEHMPAIPAQAVHFDGLEHPPSSIESAITTRLE
jgi:hypothetical protein